MSDGYISRQRIDAALLKNEKTAFKLVQYNSFNKTDFVHQIDLDTVRWLYVPPEGRIKTYDCYFFSQERKNGI